jgi:hypothetical protein
VVGVQGRIRGGGLGRRFYGTSPPAILRGLRRPGDGLAMLPAAGVTLMAADPVSTAARSCLVVASGSSMPLPSGGSRFGFGGGGRRLINGSVVATSSVDEVDRRAVAWGPVVLPIKGG